LKTKQYIISDFNQKTLKVVLTGSELLNISFRENMQAVWNMSPYEFCSESEFNASKTSTDYYFLVIAQSSRRSEEDAGINILGIYKGVAGAKDLSDLYKVVSIPFCPVENSDGRGEFVFLPAFLTILQEQVQSIMERRLNISEEVTVDLTRTTKKWSQRCAIAAEDFAEDPGFSLAATYKQSNIDVVDRDVIDRYLTERVDGILVGYVVCPDNPSPGAYCYKMLIDASTWELYYFKKHKISPKSPSGFSRKDASAIMSHHSSK